MMDFPCTNAEKKIHCCENVCYYTTIRWLNAKCISQRNVETELFLREMVTTQANEATISEFWAHNFNQKVRGILGLTRYLTLEGLPGVQGDVLS